VGGQELKSSEGTTQGDPLSMVIYAISLQPLITHLHVVSSAKQCWFAHDASGAWSVTEVKKWWDTLSKIRPDIEKRKSAERKYCKRVSWRNNN
jgi:hypothetical protein